MINRTIGDALKNKLFSGKALVVTGPRQVGKTTLVDKVIAQANKPVLFLNGDDPYVRDLLQNTSTEKLRQLIGTNRIVFIDEAQRIPGIGLLAKLIIDQFNQVQVILSGSSSFELYNPLQEPLTGRKWSFELFPISWEEWQNHLGYLKSGEDLENRLVYGLYPDVLNNRENQTDVLLELIESYLYKDVLAYASLRKPEIIQKLVQALARQVGQEVVYAELSRLIGVDAKTVSAYLEVLEKAFIIFRMPALSRNLRNEIKNNKKVYFYDNGVRNAVIRNFEPFAVRQDKGALWENFLMSERLKQNAYKKTHAFMYFWRTKQQQEVDLVEEINGKIVGFEFKWNQNKMKNLPLTFTKAYHADAFTVTSENFRDFVII